MLRTCDVPGCGKPHRARGLCSTHYNQQHQPERHAPVVKVCAVCGTPILRVNQNRYQSAACSVDCRTVIAHGGTAGASRYDWAKDAARRARLAGAVIVELITREQVFDRDDWTCYLCGDRTDPALSPFDPHAPTVDHVVPLSKGGQHTLTNVRCACLGCNSAKGDHVLVTLSD